MLPSLHSKPLASDTAQHPSISKFVIARHLPLRGHSHQDYATSLTVRTDVLTVLEYLQNRLYLIQPFP